MKNTAVGFLIFQLALIFAVAIGWVLNIVNIFKSDFELTGIFVLQVVGIFIPPLGAIMGYII